MSFGSLAKANRGNFGVIWGQSNANRCGNNSGTAAAAGFSKPAGATYWDQQTTAGSALASYTAPHHGPETGFLDEVCTVAGKTVTVVKRGMDGTALSAWNSTHCATLIADCVTAGITPRWGLLVQGENEAAASAGAADGWDADLVNVCAKFRAVWGASWGLVVVRLSSSMNGTWASNVIARQNYVSINHWYVGMVNVDGSPLAGDGIHHLSATSTLAGRRGARALLDAGLIT